VYLLVSEQYADSIMHGATIKKIVLTCSVKREICIKMSMLQNNNINKVSL